jgi:hypothetical protein
MSVTIPPVTPSATVELQGAQRVGQSPEPAQQPFSLLPGPHKVIHAF